MTKLITVVSAIVAVLGVAVGVYGYQRKKVLQTLHKCNLMNVGFVTNWISSQDMPEYNSGYIAVYMRGRELPIYNKLKMFTDTNAVVCLAIYDQANKKTVSSEYFICSTIDQELGNDKFIEFPFEP